MTVFPQLKLTYFPAAGRAEASRLALHIGGVPFVDDRIPFAKLASVMQTFPFGQLPVLEVDGRVFAQSQAILRYAGRLAKLYPTNDHAAALRIDEILHALEELQEAMSPSFWEKDAEKKRAMRLELAERTIPRYLSLLEARLATLNTYPTLQTECVLLHDVALYAFIKSLRGGFLDHIPVTIADGYALLQQSFEKVSSHPKVVEWYSIQHDTPKLKLTYFSVPARAEPIRLALFIGNVPFEDYRVPRSEYPALKPSLPYNQLPVLEVDGDVVAQSLAILRYAGRLARLYPSVDTIAAFQIDEVLCIVDELHNFWDPSYFEKDPEKQLVMRKELAEVAIPNSLGFLEKRATQNSCAWPFAVGATLTVADLAIAGLLDYLSLRGRMRGVPTSVVDPFVRLNAIRECVHAHPRVIEWNKTHDETDV